MKDKKIHPIALFSHELKTPLSSLKLACNILKKNSKNKENQEMIHLMEEELNRMIKLVCNQLDAQCLKEEDYEIKQTWNSLQDLLAEISQSFELLAKEKNIKIKITKVLDAEIFIDSVWFFQVLQNCLSNAIKFAPKNSCLFIDCEFKSKGLQLEIKNKLISQDQAKQLSFEQPSQFAYSLLTKSQGLGLKISKMIMEKHQGFLLLDFDKKQGEAKVSLFLPHARSLQKSA